MTRDRDRAAMRRAVLPQSLRPFGSRNFTLFWLGFVTTNIGKNIELTGTVWLVAELTSSPVLLGLLGLAKAVPAIVLGPIAGVVVDRSDLRRVLFITQSLGLVASLALGLLVLSGRVEVWMVYVQVAVQSAILAFDAAARQALFPTLVPRPLIGDAVTLTTSAARLAAMLGLVVGGFAIALWGEAAPFLLNSATFLGLMAALLLMRDLPKRVSHAAQSFRGEMVEGVRYILRIPILAGLFKLEVVFSLFQINAVLITIVGREVLGVGPEGLGTLLAADALGALVGIGLLLVVGQPRRQGRFNLICTVIYAGALFGFAASTSFALSFVVLALSGVMDVLLTVTRNQIVQTATPGHMRGRVMSNLGTITRGIGPIAQAQSGLVAALLGGPLAVAGSAAVILVNAVATARLNRRLWAYSRGDAAPAEEPGPAPQPEQVGSRGT